MQAEACECTLTISYTNAYRTCGICGATMRTRQEIPAFYFIIEGSCEGIQKFEYSRAVTPQIRQAGNRLSGLAETAYASLLA